MAGSQVVVRDEEWLVRSTQETPADGLLVRCMGISTLVRDTESTFLSALDRIEPLRPEDTEFIPDDSPGFRRSRLYLEAVLRKTPVPATDHGLAVAHRQLLEPLQYQRRAAHKALTTLRPRLLIADAVGLGKTLEVGMILSELIRRGRGDKILVVTPRHILEQFQHELWTRFAIPLVRLDSEGIQRMRRSIPANRNPFTVFRRAIISIDTLKNAGRYRHHLEGIHWDAVVIDECHNLVNKGTLNNQLARVLAPRTDALLLTSATPHNGDPESFAELIRLLDPTAVIDAKNLGAQDISHLYVRRHKAHDEVAREVGSRWADRLDPRPIPITASAAEDELFRELGDVWTNPVAGKAPVSGQGRSLFPWTLFKSALSSHHALAQTIEQRRKTIARQAATQRMMSAEQEAEDTALCSLADRCAAINDDNATKLTALVEQLREIGVGPNSPSRVVIFSERIATLDWLSDRVAKRLKLKANQVRTLHGGMADVKQMDVIEEFGLEQAPVRLLFTGDMASEGVNLHRQCHHLIHFDLPWSLITIEQRNGRIDRYGQESSPDIRALLLTPDHPTLGDIRIFTRLLQREHTAHRAFGESGSLLGLHNAALEEEAIMDSLVRQADPDHVIPETPQKPFDLMALLAGATGQDPVPLSSTPSLFESDRVFVDEALRAAFGDAERDLDIRREDADPEFVSFVPPRDLARRLSALPQSYLTEQRIVERLRVTGDVVVAEHALKRARETKKSMWPEIGHLSPLHPFLDWITDKVLVAVGRNQAPVLVGQVEEPVFCVQGLYANGQGRPQLVEWLAVTAEQTEPSGHRVEELFAVLDRAGIRAGMTNPGSALDPAPLRKALPKVLAAARGELAQRRAAHDAKLNELLAEPAQRLDTWEKQSRALALDLPELQRRQRDRYTSTVRDETQATIDSLRTAGEPLVRVLAVIVRRNP